MSSLRLRATSAVLSVIVTLLLAVGVDRLATPDAQHASQAVTSAPVLAAVTPAART